MSAYAWLAKLNISLDASCRCGHSAKEHLHGKSCGHGDAVTFKFCKCEEFREAQIKIQTGDNEMAKKQKKASKSRASNLLYFADEAKLEKFDEGRLLDKKEKTYSAAIAQVLVAAGKDGAAFEEIATKVGKMVEHKNETTLRRNIRWYFSSKRSEVAKFVSSKRSEPETAKTNAVKPKRARKPRRAVTSQSEQAAPVQEAASL